MKVTIIFILINLIIFTGTAQQVAIINYEDYILAVVLNHPIAKQADLVELMGDAELQTARGAFDPKFSSNYNQKYFEEKDYFSVWDNKLIIHTLGGLTINAGYKKNDGQFLDPSFSTPENGLWNAGLGLAIGKGLITDERRTALKQAKIYKDATRQEKLKLLNDLIFDASSAYINWAISREKLRLATEIRALADLRFKNTLSTAEQGDAAAIDTLEAFAILQNRVQLEQEALMETLLSQNHVEQFLWSGATEPVSINPEAQPDSLTADKFKTIFDSLLITESSLISGHPDFILSEFKINQLELERRLAKEALKPDIQLSFNPLVGSTTQTLFDTYNTNNYLIGAQFTYPLLLRKERGKAKMIQYKIESSQFKQITLQRKIGFKLQQLRIKEDLLNGQLDLSRDNMAFSSILVDAENRKYQIGESSLFLINSRESKLIENQQKYLSLLKKLIESRLEYLYTSASLSQ
ncbi:MAG: outer membrane protein TolC [Limisphaerales bacterium]|jgi:outer membrane protein TolC